MAIDLRQMRHVLALAEHGSFARAAKSLRLSQPALSRSVQSLERQLGNGLFERSAAGVVPTDVGRLFIQHARQVVQMAEEFDRAIIGNPSLHSGQVAVGGGPFPVESFLSTAMARFVGEYPNIGVRLQVRAWDELLQRLRARELDFFVAEISTMQRERDLEIEALSRHPLYFVARAGHPLARGVRVRPTDTFSYPVVALSRIPPRMLEPMLAAQRGAVDPVAAGRAFPAVECHALSAVKRIVGGSDAITALTLSCVATELEEGRFALLGGEPWLTMHNGLVRLKDAPLNQAAARLREFVVAAERESSLEEAQLIARWRSRAAAGRRRTRGS
jgi:DNA-binding transcriptional LysR family regulator